MSSDNGCLFTWSAMDYRPQLYWRWNGVVEVQIHILTHYLPAPANISPSEVDGGPLANVS